MTEELRTTLLKIWREKVDSQYLYRGMSSKDLAGCLDPSIDPFAQIRPQLRQLLEVFAKLLDAGFEFTVHEDYSGLAFPLSDIVKWTRHDLDNPGVDFISNYEYARGYSKNFQGSQLKQNFRYITNTLPGRQNDKCLKKLMREADWRLLAEINEWVSQQADNHKGVVIWLKRSWPGFESDSSQSILLGSFQYFSSRARRTLEENHLPFTIEAVISLCDQ